MGNYNPFCFNLSGGHFGSFLGDLETMERVPMDDVSDLAHFDFPNPDTDCTPLITASHKGLTEVRANCPFHLTNCIKK